MAITNNQQFWSELDNHARRQLMDAKNGSAETRKQIIRANQQAVQNGRINAALPRDAWVDMSDTVTDVVRDELRLVSDLVNTVGTHSVPLSAKLDTWTITKTTGEAEWAMTPDIATGESSTGFDHDGTPVPIAFDPFSIGFRDEPVDSSRMEGSLETQHAANSTRLVAEAIESAFVDGADYDFQVYDSNQGYDFYGMTDHPSTATGTTTADWTTDNTVVRQDFRDARGVLKNDRNYTPPFTVYLGTDYYDVLDDADPEGDGNLTIRDRVENLSGIASINELDALPAKSMLMFKATSDVLEVGQATDVQTVQQEDMFRDHFLVMAAQYPRIYQQYNVETDSLQNGILYWTA